MNIVFFGTSEFGAIVLEKLVQSGLKPVFTVTAPDKPVGRKQILTPPPAKVLALKYDLRVLQSETLANSKLQSAQGGPSSKTDLFVVASYGQILSKEILAIPKFGALNAHPSLLPTYRGSSPVQAAILNGDEVAGVTIMLMDEKVDHGPVLAQKQYAESIKSMSYLELHDALAQLGGELLVETIPQWLDGKVVPQPQDHSKATFTKRIKKEHGRIDWAKPAEYIERQVRAFQPWPGAYTTLEVKSQNSKVKSISQKPKVLKILQAEVLKQGDKESQEIGTVGLVPRNLDEAGRVPRSFSEAVAVQTGRDYLVIEELQLEGGKPMKAKEFIQGRPGFIGTTLI